MISLRLRSRFFAGLHIVGLAALLVLGRPASAAAQQDWLCDVSFEDCRTPLLDLIRNETVGIDVAFWFMEDPRYTTELIRRHQAGVRVRVLMDLKANSTYPLNATRLAELRNGGIRMRQHLTNNILHWKMMMFVGQNTVEFSSANYSGPGFVPEVPYSDYVDEVIYFSTRQSVVNSFKTKFDDSWTNTTTFSDYWNITGPPTRAYPTFPLDPEMNFVPAQNFRTRSVARYNAETQGIDAIMFRITDQNHTNALIAAHNRGVPVRLISEPEQYREPKRLWHSWNVDRLYMAGIQVRHRKHLGLTHQKSTVLHAQRMTIFGSSNWTSPSGIYQEEHNYFTTRPDFYTFFSDQFERKWYNLTGVQETEPFVPLPPAAPINKSPANGTTGLGTSVTLVWDPGYYAHIYDIYLGTTTPPPLLVAGLALGPRETANGFKQYTVTGLNPGTTYYWRVISKTMANKFQGGSTWSFITAGDAPPPPPPPPNGVPGPGDIVLHPGVSATVAGAMQKVADGTAASGARVWHPDAGAGKIATALASPTHYFQVTFNAQADTGYNVWMRLKAENNHYLNDSVHIQFSGSVTQSGAPTFRIGTTSSAVINLEDCSSGCPRPSNWGWQDTGYGAGVFGEPIYFAASGSQTIRVQAREDGVSIDQILLSPVKFRSLAPGPLVNDATIYPTGGGGGTPPPSEAVMLTDDFNDSALDTARWLEGNLFTGAEDPAIQVGVDGQALVIGPLSSGASGSHYYGVRSRDAFAFSGAYAQVQLLQRPSSATQAHAMFAVGVSSYFYRWYVEGTTLVAEKRAGSKTPLTSLTYDQTAHQYLRIRHEPGTGRVVYETAPDSGGSPGAWTSQFTEPWDPTIPLTNVLFELKGGTSTPQTDPGVAGWDNFRAATVS